MLFALWARAALASLAGSVLIRDPRRVGPVFTEAERQVKQERLLDTHPCGIESRDRGKKESDAGDTRMTGVRQAHDSTLKSGIQAVFALPTGRLCSIRCQLFRHFHCRVNRHFARKLR